jgi:MFS family permease
MIVAAALVPLIVLIVRYHPRDMGLNPDDVSETAITPLPRGHEATQASNQTGAAVDWTLVKAARTKRFWLLCLSTFCISGIVQTLMVAHHVVFAMDMGYSSTYASSVLSLFGIMFACGCLAGMMSDWIGRETTMTIGTLIGISGILILMFITGPSRPWMLYYYAIALGFGQGMGVPTITASIVDIFRGPRVGAIIGSVWFSFAVGGAIGPWLGGWIFEMNESYLLAFIAVIVSYAVGCMAIWGAAPGKGQTLTID